MSDENLLDDMRAVMRAVGIRPFIDPGREAWMRRVEERLSALEAQRDLRFSDTKSWPVVDHSAVKDG